MKKKVASFISALMLVMVCIYTLPTTALAESSNLDEIQNYEIKVDVRQDGTLDIRYAIDWKVLSDKEGTEPVTWVDVGIPNEHVDQIQSLTDNIESAEYSSKSGGSYVRVDFKNEYYQGEIISFEFAIHQSYMYLLDESDTVRYAFTPGWFEDIEIVNLQIEWAVKDGFTIKETDSNEQSSTYYIWSYQNLAEGEKVTANVKYDSAGFYVDEDMQYEEDSGSILLIIGLVIVGIFAIIVIAAAFADDYDGGRGYGGGGRTYIHSSCAHSSCACACACAGGGRAGCSVKNFYSNEPVLMSVKDFEEAVEEIKKGR